MAANLHRCAAEGCTKEISRGLLMCIDHWRMVPHATQLEVKRAWRAFQSAGITERKAYLDAVKRAVAAVREREIKRQTKRQEGQPALFGDEQ